ncbi:MAG: hypothetical protein D3905_04975 [Candidatus Electrothrix sp. AS4_5]|nr:hypothetical protein [Candidatus Electrothrix gigas]MCI5178261.1 hypothetical protein [Candidatus Electrothrix gigas]MCI5189151.1 hypothetical protein [Candidatus Electrothrix gigas]
MDKSRLWLCLPFVPVCLIDAGVTLSGQAHEYWQGNWQYVEEVFPLFAWVLSSGPGAFVLACLAWIAVFGGLIVLAPDVIAEILSLALVNGHTWGTMTWLVYDLKLDYHLCLLFFVFTGSLFILSHRKWRLSQQY